MYDLIIKNGRLIDGTGSPVFRADIAVKDGKIARICRGLEHAAQVIDASGLVVTPGFIDSHSHSDHAILSGPGQKEKVEQGITTSIAGQCGSTDAPLSRNADPTALLEPYGTTGEVLGTMGRFLDLAKDVPQGANIAVFVGHRALRTAVMGTENRAPTTAELEQMKRLLRDGMEHGAMGISFGLIYVPGCYAKTDELIELAKVAAEYNGLVSAHIRNESDTLIEATEEFLSILKASGARGILSHHKAALKQNWGKVNQTLQMIDRANEDGIDVYLDVYPYCASGTGLRARFIPKEFNSGSVDELTKMLQDPEMRKELRRRNVELWGEDLNWVLIPKSKLFPNHPGLRIPELAALCGKEPYDVVFDLIQSQPWISVNFFSMCEEDLETVMSHPRAMICTDSGVITQRTPCYHPRMIGTFPRALGRYVRERKVLPLPEMIRKMTSMPAAVYGLTGKGILAEGFDADLCIFDPDKIIDRADFVDLTRRAEGFCYVLVGGQVVAENAVYNGMRPGKVLLRSR